MVSWEEVRLQRQRRDKEKFINVEKFVILIVGAILGLLLACSMFTLAELTYAENQLKNIQTSVDVLPDVVDVQLNDSLNRMTLDIESDLKKSDEKITREINDRVSAYFDDLNRTLDKRLPQQKKNKRR